MTDDKVSEAKVPARKETTRDELARKLSGNRRFKQAKQSLGHRACCRRDQGHKDFGSTCRRAASEYRNAASAANHRVQISLLSATVARRVPRPLLLNGLATNEQTDGRAPAEECSAVPPAPMKPMKEDG